MPSSGIALMCAALCAGSALGADVTWVQNQAKYDKSNNCPKVFVPGRAGGFISVEGRQGCCVAGGAAGLMQVIYAMHKCKSFHKDPSQSKQECYYGALDDLIAMHKYCCRDGDEDDDKCKAEVAQSVKALNDDLRTQSTACMDAKNNGKHSKQACQEAVDGGMKAFVLMLSDAASLYDAGDATDYTKLSRGFVSLCDSLDEPRCLSKVRYVIKHYHLNFAW